MVISTNKTDSYFITQSGVKHKLDHSTIDLWPLIIIKCIKNVDIQYSGQAAYAQSQIWNQNHLKVLTFLDQVTQMA
jgi:hypothetical protein